MFHRTPLKFGNLTLAHRVLYAPLAGCSDFPFRMMTAKYRPALMYTEMVKMDALIRNDAYTFSMLDYDPSMHPIAGQLCGSKPELAGPTAKMIEDLGFNLVDLNCGCPVDKVTKDGSGSGMLKTPEKIGEIISNMVAAVKIPVTLKIRAGWDENSICVEQIVQIAEQAGAAAICIHGRTRQQAYRGPANWDWIKRGKEAAKTIYVIGNGDVNDGPSAQRMFEYTGCDAVLVARSTMGQPWIAEDILRHLDGSPPVDRGVEIRRQHLLEHFHFCKQYLNEQRLCTHMRKIGCWYIKRSAGTRMFREQISRASDHHFVENLIKTYPFVEGEAEEPEEGEVMTC